MSIITLMEDIGDDLDLIIRSDEWLEEERKSITAEMDRIAHELRSIQIAQRLKRHLQQSNLVAVQSLVKDDNGDVSDINISIMPMKEAMECLRNQSDSAYEVINKSQICCWRSDGYDVD